MEITKCPPGNAIEPEDCWPQKVSVRYGIKPKTYIDAQIIGWVNFGYAETFAQMVENAKHFMVKKKDKHNDRRHSHSRRHR